SPTPPRSPIPPRLPTPPRSPMPPRFPTLPRLPPCRPISRCAARWRFASESPREVPPKRLAVPRSPYGAPPRCDGLCCHLFPLRLPTLLTRLPPWIFVLRLKLLFMLMSTSPPPQPQPQPQPPPHAAPMAKPTPKEIALAAITAPVDG